MLVTIARVTQVVSVRYSTSRVCRNTPLSDAGSHQGANSLTCRGELFPKMFRPKNLSCISVCFLRGVPLVQQSTLGCPI